MNPTINFFDEHGICLGSFIERLKAREFDEKITTDLDRAINATGITPIYWALGFDKPIFLCGSPCTPKKALELMRDAIAEPDFVVIRDALLMIEAMEEKRGGAQCH
ncbi:TPA: hypothetical protein NKV98_004412 [Vibrio parahaemolyticus]|uniref:hypothetical protein n=1 Tax=Vibrio harveyi group TaxID=717610 RepID=UPI00093473FE|nr:MULTISPECIES: hypothetical protein [Vibrio harveyi group]EGQ8195813.1 hypothetical protein [Vibrio parahaemolyticus]NOH90821.1 hypothetical protein [Vibrio alginolyticus]TPA13949.1 hypothetical protein DXJ89_24910 [Vibrio parahaemolyticus]TPA40117.1 hypothetical protein DXJ91_24955 [Vibrio parahaemolyticus]TPA53878.1 hypothetical protein DXJ90_24815 [Vibrio parahaemolyticus]